MIRLFRATDFRCLRKAELRLGPRFNLISGSNASGKTSLLEALAYLGRGKSFRGASVADLTRHGANEFILFGEVDGVREGLPVGVRNSREGLEVRVGGTSAPGGVAALAEALPLQVIDPDIHNLIAGGPELRRRFLDWVAFHVEQGHLLVWRRFRRVLKQRNAALKAGSSREDIRRWDAQLCELGEQLDGSRRRALASTNESLNFYGQSLLQTELTFEYQSGWSRERSLDEALERGFDRDQQFGATQSGPHRADLAISASARRARRLVSRGQQKLLASAMILAATQTVQSALAKPLLLLLDDPAAELDRDSVVRLMDAVAALGCQVVATSLDPGALTFPETPTVFHVERGVISAAQ